MTNDRHEFHKLTLRSKAKRFANNNNFKHKQMKISISSRKMVKGFAILLVISLIATGCFSRNYVKRKTTGEEPFFQNEEGIAEHGKKKP